MRELGELLTLEYGAALPAQIRTGHGFPVFGSNGVVGHHAKYLVEGPGIIVGRKGSVGKVGWSSESFWPIDTTYWVKCSEGDRRWAFWLLSWLPLGRLDSSTGVPGLNRGDVYRLQIFEPSAEKKQAIASVLDTLDTGIRQTEAIVEKLKQVKQGLLHDLLTRGIDANGELRPPRSQAPHLYKVSPLGWIPREWSARPLAEIVATTPNAIVDGPFGSNLKSEHYRSSGIPVIQSGYVTSGEFHAETYVYVTLQHFQTQARSRVDPGDIVMAKIGANAGMCAVLPPGHAFGILAGNCMKITADDCVVRRDWLVRYLHRLYQVTGMSDVRTETAQPAISLGRIRKLLVPVPPNVEQEGAACALESIEESLRTELKAASKMRVLKAALMDDLLTGRVRVNQLLA